MNIDYKLQNIDLCKAGVIGDLDTLLCSVGNLDALSIKDIVSMCPERKDVTNILIGLWALGFLKHPLFNSELGLEGLRNYRKETFSKEEQNQILEGLLNIIRYSHIEMPEDHDAIDYIYSSCRNLYLLIPKQLEDLLVKELLLSPTVSFIDALGVLVRVKHSITKKTFSLLKKISEAENNEIALKAKEVLEEDIKPMNEIYHFH